MTTDALKGLKGRVIAAGENKGFAFGTLKLGANADVTEVTSAKFTLTPVVANTALLGGTWAT